MQNNCMNVGILFVTCGMKKVQEKADAAGGKKARLTTIGLFPKLLFQAKANFSGEICSFSIFKAPKIKL